MPLVARGNPLHKAEMGLSPLLHVSSEGAPPPPEHWNVPGGFLWWYADFFDRQGNGVVLIWSFGLPFLPGIQREGALPRSRPSLNLVVYRSGREDFYLLQEYPRDAVSMDGNRWRFGRTTLALVTTDGTQELQADLDVAVPGSRDRLTGSMVLSGVRAQWSDRTGERAAGGPAPAHDWCLGTARATGTASLRLAGKPYFSATGPGYQDRNGGTRPLWDLGISAWLWGRAPFEDAEWVYYLLWPEAHETPTFHLFRQDADGSVTALADVAAEILEPRLGRYGMLWWKTLILSSEGTPRLTVSLPKPLDDGPFYLRFLAEAENAAGTRTVGTLELCRPQRVDLPVLRPLVRMRVHHLAQENSFWLPLFSGGRQGRVVRQWRHAARRLLGKTPTVEWITPGNARIRP